MRLDKRRIGIVGSRSLKGDDESIVLANEARREHVRSFVSKLNPQDHIVVSGGASGADRWAQEAAEELGITVVVHRPDWNKYGNSAGFKRNKLIVRDSDDIVAFWDGESRGTEHTIKTAIEAGKSVAVFSIITGALIRFVDKSYKTLPVMAVPKNA